MVLARHAFKLRLREARAKPAPTPVPPPVVRLSAQAAVVRIQRQARRMVMSRRLGPLLRPLSLIVRPLHASFCVAGEAVANLEWQLSLSQQDWDGSLRGVHKTESARMDGARVLGRAMLLRHVTHRDTLRLSLVARACVDRDRVNDADALLSRNFRREGRSLVSNWVTFYERDIVLRATSLPTGGGEDQPCMLRLRGEGGRFCVRLPSCLSAPSIFEDWVQCKALRPLQPSLQGASGLLPSSVDVVLEVAPTHMHGAATLAKVHRQARLIDAPVLESADGFEVGGLNHDVLIHLQPVSYLTILY